MCLDFYLVSWNRSQTLASILDNIYNVELRTGYSFLFILVLSQIHGHNLIDQSFRLTEPSIEAVRTWNSPRLWLMISTKQFTADVVKSPCRTSTQFLASLLWIPMGQQQFKGCQQEYSCSFRNSVWEDIQLHGWSN